MLLYNILIDNMLRGSAHCVSGCRQVLVLGQVLMSF